jgi:hypothetical protein
MLTEDVQLVIYKNALFDYRVSKRLPFMKKWLRTESGFCSYFKKVCDLEELTVLYSLKPKPYRVIWFYPGTLEPRIQLLKQAISTIEERKNRPCKKSSFLIRIKRYLNK